MTGEASQQSGSGSQQRRIHLSVPHMSGLEQRFVQQAFDTNWISTVGPHLTAFEQEFEAMLGLPCVALSSGTAALHLGLRLLGVGPGDIVFCSTLTFVASANPIRYLGAEPVFIDSSADSWNMDPAVLEIALEQSARDGRLPRAVVVVDLYGQPADMDAIRTACDRYRVPILDDAAEALGAVYKGRPAGVLGDLAAFSFNGNKIITTSGGGMLASPRRDWIEKARFWSQQARNPAAGYEHSELGFNYRMSNVLAGIGRGQLPVLGERVQQRRAIALRYRAAFAALPGVEPMPETHHGVSTHWLSCFLLDQARFGWNRDELIQALELRNIEARAVWRPMHLQPLYSGCRVYGGEVAEDLFRRGFCLPSSSNLSADDQLRVVNAVREATGAPALAALPAVPSPHPTQEAVNHDLA